MGDKEGKTVVSFRRKGVLLLDNLSTYDAGKYSA